MGVSLCFFVVDSFEGFTLASGSDDELLVGEIGVLNDPSLAFHGIDVVSIGWVP